MMNQFVVWELRGVRLLCLQVEGDAFVTTVARLPGGTKA